MRRRHQPYLNPNRTAGCRFYKLWVDFVVICTGIYSNPRIPQVHVSAPNGSVLPVPASAQRASRSANTCVCRRATLLPRLRRLRARAQGSNAFKGVQLHAKDFVSVDVVRPLCPGFGLGFSQVGGKQLHVSVDVVRCL